jgi:hypothetical protein
MKSVTYGQLDKVLRALGFCSRLEETAPKARVYEHPETRALIVLPVFADTEMVLSHHLAAVRGTLDRFGIAAPLDFEGRLQKAS